jgi:eukaryotic-like serine/threonine-protein kinase
MEKWAYQTGNFINSSPAVAGGVVYVGSDAASGTKKWAYPTGGDIGYSSPAVANGVAYIGSNDDNLYAFHLPGT